jgi:hypothetical protein
MKSVIVISLAVGSAIILAVSKQKEIKESNATSVAAVATSTATAAKCPAAYEAKDPGEFGVEYVAEGPKYDHCKKCDIGVYMLHKDEHIKTCTYCSHPQSANAKDN